MPTLIVSAAIVLKAARRAAQAASFDKNDFIGWIGEN
jgi:hypothetical protein